MGKDYRLEIEINAPRSRVCELFGDPENLGAWQPGYLGIEAMEGEPGTAGAKSRLRYAHGKREVEMIETLETDDLPDEFSAIYEAKGMKMTVRNRFEEQSTEKTKWISDNEAQVSGIIMRLVAMIMPGCFKKQSYRYMKNFKAFVEEGKDLRSEQ